MAGQWARSRQLLGLQTAAADGSLLQAKLHLYPRFLPDHQPVAHFPPVSHFLQNHKDFLLHQLTLKPLKSKRPLMTSNDKQTQLGELILLKHTQHQHQYRCIITDSWKMMTMSMIMIAMMILNQPKSNIYFWQSTTLVLHLHT